MTREEKNELLTQLGSEDYEAYMELRRQMAVSYTHLDVYKRQELLMAGRDMREAGDALMQQGEKRNDVYRARTAVQKFLEELWEDNDDEE